MNNLLREILLKYFVVFKIKTQKLVQISSLYFDIVGCLISTEIMDTAIGIMDSAYFVPRHEILKWINNILTTNVQNIQDLGSGAIYCQLIDAAFGQKVPMNKVNWKAKFGYQFLTNLKIFKECIEKLSISKNIEIQKLAKGKYQDNLAHIQWLKRYIQINGNIPNDYNALQRRNYAVLQSITQAKRHLTPILRNNPSGNINKSFNQTINQSQIVHQGTPNTNQNKNTKYTPYKMKTEENVHIQQQKYGLKEINEIKQFKQISNTKLNEVKSLKNIKVLSQKKSNNFQLNKQNNKYKKDLWKSGNKKEHQIQNGKMIKSFNQPQQSDQTLSEIRKVLLSQQNSQTKLEIVERMVLGYNISTYSTKDFIQEEQIFLK